MNLKLNISLFFIVLLFMRCTEDKTTYNNKGNAIKHVDEFLITNQKDLTKILMVGTFHFDYPGFDAHVTKEEDKVNVLSSLRQKQMKELVDYIALFKPDKIVIEATKKWNATSKLRAFKLEDLKVKRDERYQIGMRLAKMLNIDTLYALDSDALVDDLYKLNKEYISKIFELYDFSDNDEISKKYTQWYDYQDKLQLKMTLLDYFKYMNSEDNHRRDYGAYLVGDFKLPKTTGADALSMHWYNRNLRIFRKIQDITEGKGEKIMVLFGNGHVSLLRHLFECSPEYKLIEFGSLNQKE